MLPEFYVATYDVIGPGGKVHHRQSSEYARMDDMHTLYRLVGRDVINFKVWRYTAQFTTIF